ncbi:SusD/RagB family nutrient-binding outer membrane lipoprotein [Sphingobacterium sp. SGG-5]|uniref:SusD/RagB family nutrient-binding outer membrane lipoprotein n=1 Tax=Sphingobacterium sp. SGG-5 TaxID=2710881 RepID=UPI0013EE022E|nr:SusD/RagB family nutrient-binding outer membrane lipoprotein [Sphingobacterium sp. SGG-5]NGM63199.1 SusD/RagB family nutrient-binding outer membrane lipoprotein [Sphingobacterium sp. SGG-5]
MKQMSFKLLLILLIWTAGGCTKGFDELLHNPNGVQEALPKNLLSPVLYDIVTTDVKQAFRVGNELMQYTIYTVNNSYVQRYDIRVSAGDSMWGYLYTCANNIADMEEKAEALDQPNYLAIALTLKALVFSRLTDTYGNIPYFEALHSRGPVVNFLPKYDKQEEIYASLLEDLERAALLFDKNAELNAGGDLLYQGDVTKWMKFCNSLRLRLYLRVSNRPEMESPIKIDEIISNPSLFPIFTNADEQAYLPFTNEAPYYNPYYNSTTGEFGSQRSPSTFILNILQGFSDPRLGAWYTKSLSEYTGAPAGFPIGMADEIGKTSYLKNGYRTSPKLGMVMSYAELQFILAEAALKGWTGSPADAKTYYENGIKASMSFWGVSVPSGYLTQIGVAYDDQLSTIMLQKYLSLFFVGQEAWYEHRRTGYPVLTVHEQAYNNGNIPRRLLYPTTTQKYNRANYDEAVSWIGGDNINVRCWWEDQL